MHEHDIDIIGKSEQGTGHGVGAAISTGNDGDFGADF
jgi:hypothetical protein